MQIIFSFTGQWYLCHAYRLSPHFQVKLTTFDNPISLKWKEDIMCVWERERVPVKKNLRHSVFYPLVSLPRKVHPRGKVLIKMTLSYKVNQGGYLKKDLKKWIDNLHFSMSTSKSVALFFTPQKQALQKLKNLKYSSNYFYWAIQKVFLSLFGPGLFVGLPI